ncbi:hypothetical protein BN1321_50012 [Staphylococcus aureus]|uniref:Uncharacterized protein n=1 Tax=Staphylococcus aureus TaxID=1280 RepID=A0A0U1MXB2_STAAU|nr:hypothetical protein BN1321_50012 [Staphylococcus aureus]
MMFERIPRNFSLIVDFGFSYTNSVVVVFSFFDISSNHP